MPLGSPRGRIMFHFRRQSRPTPTTGIRAAEVCADWQTIQAWRRFRMRSSGWLAAASCGAVSTRWRPWLPAQIFRAEHDMNTTAATIPTDCTIGCEWARAVDPALFDVHIAHTQIGDSRG